MFALVTGEMDYPFPPFATKVQLANKANLKMRQVQDFFRNYRWRVYWPTKVVEKLLVKTG